LFVCCGISSGRKTISGGFTKDERRKFHNLLKLAAESPFEGERQAALAAAKRLAKKHGMSLEDAAADHTGRDEDDAGSEARAKAKAEAAQNRPWAGAGYDAPPGFEERWGFARKKAANSQDWRATDEDRERFQEAVEEAKKRGLDENEEREKPAPRRQQAQRRSSRRMHPPSHARALLRETTFSIEEIAAITELSVMEITGIKLKMRSEPKPKLKSQGRYQRAR
jgi:hypothetical protein